MWNKIEGSMILKLAELKQFWKVSEIYKQNNYLKNTLKIVWKIIQKMYKSVKLMSIAR